MRMNEDKKATLYDSLSKEEKAVSIPYYVHEWEMFRMERMNKRWFIAFLIVLAMLFATNIGWVIYESQFVEEVITQEVDTGDGAAVVSGTGDAIYGEGKTDGQETNP